MNECERIIKDNVLPKTFFEPEWICDFYVDEKRKKIWAIELDILKKIHDVCEKHHLKYVLAAGSLLGAVRHNGCIPWDDDIDITMPREDYDIFLSLDNEFSNPYFLQKPCEDNGFYYAGSRVRNSNTTALDYPFVFQDFNHGIFVDIKPYDKIDISSGREAFQQADQLICKNSTAMRLTHPRLKAKDMERVLAHDNEDPVEVYNKLNSLIQSFQMCKTDYVAYFTSTTYGFDRNVYRKEWFSDRIPIELYGIKTYIPCGYEEILKHEYGDYMTMPPLESRGKWHGNILFIPDTPYQNILSKIREDIINDKWNL